MFGTRTQCLLAIAALAFGATAASATTVSWDGQTWGIPYGSAAVNGSNLDITATSLLSDGNYYGAAHYNTSTAFRSASTPYLQATFRDSDGATGDGYLAFEQESGTGKSWAEIGVDPDNGTDAKYTLSWWNEATNVTGEVDLAPRTLGDHTFKIGRRADHTVDFYFDGTLVYSTTSITPAYFGDVYLFSVSPTSGSVATFTNFTSGTDYAVSTPLPNTAASGALLIGGLLTTRKLRRRQSPA